MQLPQAVAGVLAADSSSYEVLDSASSPANGGCCVTAVVLSDPNGRVQMLFATDTLLDLAALNRFCGRDFSALPDEAIKLLCASRAMQTIPAIPGVFDMPVLVDRRVLESPQLLLDAGLAHAVIQLSSETFRTLVESSAATVGSFCLPLAELGSPSSSAQDDVADIGNAVAKFTTRRIERRLEDTLDFPPLPEIAHKIIQVSADPYASMGDLARIVEIDPSLSAQVVSWAASPYYAAPGKVNSIQDAIVRVLGFDLVMNLALGLALGKTMRLPKEGRYGYRSYWLQAVHCAALVEGLCKAMPSERRPQLGSAYLCGLLHNFGFLILAELFKPQLQLICRYTEVNPHIGHWAVEKFLLGMSREQIASWLMRFWHLPEDICSALRFQQEPQLAEEHEVLATVLHVAVRLLRQQGLGSASTLPLPDSMFASLGISRSDAIAVSERVQGATEDLTAIARSLAA